MSICLHISLFVYGLAVELIFDFNFGIEVEEVTGVIPWSAEDVVGGVCPTARRVEGGRGDVHVALMVLFALAVPAGLTCGTEASVVGVDGGLLAVHGLLVVWRRLNKIIGLLGIPLCIVLLFLGPTCVIHLLYLDLLCLLRAILIIKQILKRKGLLVIFLDRIDFKDGLKFEIGFRKICIGKN